MKGPFDDIVPEDPMDQEPPDPDYTAECATCAATAYGVKSDVFPEWSAWWTYLKKRGWRAYKDAQDNWLKSCPDCTAAWAKKQAPRQGTRR